MNPFSYGTIVRGDAFFDRVKETDLLTSTLAGGNIHYLFFARLINLCNFAVGLQDCIKIIIGNDKQEVRNTDK